MKIGKIAIFILLVSSLYAYNVKNYKDGIFYVEFSGASPIKEETAILFNTHIKSQKAFLLNNGKIIVFENKTLKRYRADGTLEKTVQLEFKPDIVIPSNTGNIVIIGKAMRDSKTYNLYLTDLDAQSTKLITTLDSDHFPGVYAPIEKVKKAIKKAPSFKNDYFSYMYEYANFESGFVDGNTLYIWYRPNHSLYFGAIYAISLKDGKLKVINDRLNYLCGRSSHSLYYTVLKDENAAEMDNAIYIYTHGKEKRIPLPFSVSSTIFCKNSKAAFISGDSLYILNIKTGKIVAKSKLSGENSRILGISPSGNRVFVSCENENNNLLVVYDVRNKKTATIHTFNSAKPGALTLSYDGEALGFIFKDTLFLGYIEDRHAPFVRFNPPDTSFNQILKITVKAHDVSFVSGLSKILFNDNPISSNASFTVKLKKGENVFTIKATDRAKNTKLVRKKVVYKEKGEK